MWKDYWINVPFAWKILIWEINLSYWSVSMDITNIVFVNGLVKEIQRVPYVVKIFCSIKYKMVLRGGKHHNKHRRSNRKKRVSLSKRMKRTWRRLKKKTQKRRRRTMRASKRLKGGWGGGGAYGGSSLRRGGAYQVGGKPWFFNA